MILSENTIVAERFKLSRMIGQGGMGSVWQATDLRLSTTCAVKFIEGEMAGMAEAHARFQREAQAAAQLRSPHVVQIFDHGVWQGTPYIAMELLDGEDLGKRITKQGGRLTNAVMNAVIQQVCRALSKAHAAGVVHRDLKPDNIFLVTDDDREIVKILDFGVAKSAAQALDGSNTKTGAMLGTPYYMSPEQAQGIKSVDSRSDLWSLAVIVFQCLTGRLPFESEALGDLLVKIIVNPIPTPSSYNAALPASFDQWWTKAADRNPDNRFQSAKAFADSLELALGQSSVTEVTDRSRLMRQVGGTAVMSSGDVLARVANTPMPGGAPGPLTTPHPHMQTPQQMQSPPYGGPMMQTPEQAHQYAAVAANNPIAGTFPGVEPASGIPKKGAPVALFAGIGVVVLLVLGIGGATFMKGRGAHGSAAAASSELPAARELGSASAAAPVVASAPVAASAAPAPADPPAAASVAKDPEPPVAAAAGGGTHRPTTGAGGAGLARPGRSPAAPATSAGTAAAAPAAPASAKKPQQPQLNLGF